MSLKIININNFSGDSLTVDTTLISVDTTEITADATLTNVSGYNLILPFRFFTQDVILTLWEELKETSTSLPLQATDLGNGSLSIDFFYEFSDNETFEATLKDINDKLIWRGKILATIQTDLENYILHTVNTNNVYKI
jgi:hypothetical protein